MDDMFSLPAEPAGSVKIRKIRAPKHDFKDGNGKVFAHRHENGGGWVADTAFVAKSAQVTRNAQVYGLARVYDDCRVTGTSHVCGRAKLINSSSLFHRAHINGLAVCDGSQLKDDAFVTGYAVVAAGSYVDGHSTVADNAVLRTTRLHGPPARKAAYIGGRALLSDSFIYGFTYIEDAVVVVDSRINNVALRHSAMLLSSTLTTEWHYLYSNYLRSPDATVPHALANRVNLVAQTGVVIAPETTEIAVMNAMADERFEFTGTAVHSELRLPRCFVRHNSAFVHASLAISIAEAGDTIRFFDELDSTANCHLFGNMRSSNINALRRFVADGGDRPNNPNVAAAIAAATSRGIAPANLEIVRQRRLLRLEEPTA